MTPFCLISSRRFVASLVSLVSPEADSVLDVLLSEAEEEFPSVEPQEASRLAAVRPASRMVSIFFITGYLPF